jgi:hypothetical protein
VLGNDHDRARQQDDPVRQLATNGKLTCRYHDAYEADAQELGAEERAKDGKK